MSILLFKLLCLFIGLLLISVVVVAVRTLIKNEDKYAKKPGSMMLNKQGKFITSTNVLSEKDFYDYYDWTIDKKTRDFVFKKYDGKCAYCGIELHEKGWHVDPINPKHRGHEDVSGEDNIDNFNPTCRRCNIWKKTYSLEDFRAEIADQANQLTRDSAQFRLAMDYGIIQSTEQPVIFYFEKCI